MDIKKSIILLLISFLDIATLKAQDVPIGNWKSHFAYTSSSTVEVIGNKIYSGSRHLYSYDIDQNDFMTYTKINALSDINITLLRYDKESANMILIYENGNIDLYDQGKVRNIPDIKNMNASGSKRINNVLFFNKMMYLATDFGIVVIDPARREIKETYVLQRDGLIVEVKDIMVNTDTFYAATSAGICKAAVNTPVLQNFANWQFISNQSVDYAITFQGNVFFANTSTLFQYTSSQIIPVYSALAPIARIRTGVNAMYLCEVSNSYKAIKKFSSDATLLDSIKAVNPYDVVEFNGGEPWVADYWVGMTRILPSKEKVVYRPNSIFDNNSYNLSQYDNDIFVSGGAEKSWVYTFNSSGFSQYKNGEWTSYNRFVNTPAMDTITDILDVAVDPSTGYIYAASFGGGLLEYRPADNSSIVHKNTPFIQAAVGDPNSYRIVSLAFDKDNNLWMSNYAAPEQLVVKKKDGSWQKFAFQYSTNERTASQILIDNANQKWMVAPRGIGIYVLNDNNTIDNKSDDKMKRITTGVGFGNLPSNEVYCMAKDRDGKLWIGTGDGIAIFNCAEAIFSQSSCDAELKVVKYDLDAGLLFQREIVKTIAVDGANNKWIGTNNGVWLITSDAEKILRRFTVDNSPLPSNEINKIIVHPQTGEVYIATNAGLISYRGEATQSSPTNQDLSIFPNPVPADFNGIIAIKGLVEDADVRITDVAGQLVYRTKAQGGQAVWNGLKYTGDKPRSGVYFVFVTNKDGSETNVGKFVMYE